MKARGEEGILLPQPRIVYRIAYIVYRKKQSTFYDQRWRYRLGVRMDGSQPFDRGSNPRSATKSSVSSFSLLVSR